jgi:outer membrane protein assembly factor BamB
MRRLAYGLLGTVLVAANLAAQQPRSTFYTTPLPPPREVLDRLNLQMSWRGYVPMDGRQDGLVTVQLHGPDLYVQTRSGLVTLLDAETGVARWRTRVGRPYVAMYALAFNSREVYVVNNTYLYALDKRNGAPHWQYRLPEGVAASPVADENLIYVPSQSSRLTAYYLPRADLPPNIAGGMTSAYDRPAAKKVETAEERRKRIPSVMGERQLSSTTISHLTPSVREAVTEDESQGPQPARVWSAVTSLRLELPVAQTSGNVLVPTPDGIVASYGKLPQANGSALEVYRFPTESTIHVPIGHFNEVAYVAADDANLYALQISSGKLLWRHTSGTALSRKPAVTDQDVFVVAARNGMTRLDRATGSPLWRIPTRSGLAESNTTADRFLAVNPKYVYAADASGRLLVLDHRRGVTLSGFDFKDFVFPVPNEVTDRLYLAANNGLIVCLHDREYQQPIRYRQAEEEAENPARIKLKQPMGEEAPRQILRDLLDSWTKRYPPLKFRIAERAFKNVERESPAAKAVTLPRGDRLSLGDALKEALATIKCTFTVVGDTIVILPAAEEAPER